MASEAEYFSTARTTVVATAGMTAAPPFQATKLWNEIVYDFCAGIPLKTYRKRFKTYKHCFPASKAVDWLYEYLQKHHGHNVSRQKALKLLRKFVKTGIVEKVNGSDENYELRDNKELYQLKGKV